MNNTVYRGFVIEKDETIETELYYIRRQDGGKWSVDAESPEVSVESIQGTLEDAKAYVNSIEDKREENGMVNDYTKKDTIQHRIY